MLIANANFLTSQAVARIADRNTSQQTI